MSTENKTIKTTVIADTKGFRQGMQEAAQDTEAFAQRTAAATGPTRELGGALDGLGAGAGTVTDALAETAAEMASTASQAAGLSVDVGALTQAIALVGGLFGTAAVGVGAFTVAMVAGQREVAGMQLALDSTSNYAGQTVGSLRELAGQVAASGQVSIGSAKEIATQLAASGKIGQGAFDLVAASAANFARVTGTEVAKVGPELVRLFEDPAKGAEKLNEQMHFLTVAEIEQIRTLQEMGRQTEAQTVLAERLNQKLGAIPENLNILERAWRAAGNAASTALDKMMGAGREKSNLESIREVAQDIERGTTDGYGGDSGARASLSRLLQKQVSDYEKARQEAEAAERNARNQQGMELVRQSSNSYKASELRAKIALVESMATADTNQATQKVEALKKLNDELNDLLNPKEPKAARAAAPKAVRPPDDDRIVGDWQKRVALLDAEAAGTAKLTATEQAYVSVLSDVTAGRVKLTAAGRGRLAVLASEALALEATQNQEKAAAKAAEEHAKWLNGMWQADEKETRRLEEALKKEAERVDALGLTKQAVNDLAAAQLQEAAAAKEVYAENLKAASCSPRSRG